VKHREGNTNSPELLLLKTLPLAYHHSHFLATLDFTSFFTATFLGATHFFTAGLFWIRYNYQYQGSIIILLCVLVVQYIPFFPVLQIIADLGMLAVLILGEPYCYVQ